MKVFLVLVIIFYSQIDAMEKMPETIPEDIEIEYFKPMGQNGKGYSMQISLKKCSYEERFLQRKNGFNFTISRDEIANFYKLMKVNKFQEIELSENFINDFDEESVKISWEGKSIDITQSGRTIKSSWKKKWKNITSTLENIRKREIEKVESNIDLILDESLIGSFVHIQIDSINFLLRDYIDANWLKTNLIHLKMIPGEHSVSCILYRDYNLEKKKEIFADFDPARKSLWDEKHSKYVRTLKRESVQLTIETTEKKNFRLVRNKNKLEIQ